MDAPHLKVLFLCTGNSARSLLAEALLRHHGGGEIEAYSAGVEPRGVNPLTLQVLLEKGISTDGLESKDVGEYLGKLFFSHVVVVCSRAAENCPTAWPGVHEIEHMYFDDPAQDGGTQEQQLARFRDTRDRIEAELLRWIPLLETAPKD